MKHILTYNKLFESKVNDNILDLLDDTFIDWIDNKSFEKKELRILGYTDDVNANGWSSFAKVGNYIFYQYEVKMSGEIDINEIIPKINYLNKTGFIVKSYNCEKSSRIINGEYSSESLAKISFIHEKIKYKLVGGIDDCLEGLKKLGFKLVLNYGDDRWELRKTIPIETDKKVDTSLFKVDGNLRSGAMGKVFKIYEEDFTKVVDDQIKILSNKIPEFSNGSEVKDQWWGVTDLIKEADDFYVQIRFSLKVSKNKPPRVIAYAYIKNKYV